jgi:hypothetical protein
VERAIGWGNLRAFLTVLPLHNFGKFMVFFSRLQTMMRKACWKLLVQNAENARPFACGGGAIGLWKARGELATNNSNQGTLLQLNNLIAMEPQHPDTPHALTYECA